MEKKFVLFDGQCIEKEEHEFLYQYFIRENRTIFKLINNSLLLNFVGYIEIIHDNVKYSLYCFPKEYQLVISEEKISSNCEIIFQNKREQIELDGQIKQVIASIKKADYKQRKLGNSDDNGIFTANLYYLNEIINHFQQYGVVVESNKQKVKSQSGRINWHQTVRKILPKYSNNNYVYENFIVDSKEYNHNILSKIIARIILEGSKKYNFYLPVIDTGIDYEEIKYLSEIQMIEILYDLKNKTYKDYLTHVIDNLILYLKGERTNSEKGLLIGTSKYEQIWEVMIASALGKDYSFQEKRIITDDSYPELEKNIYLDHYNAKEKRIVDSKYYNDSDEVKIDYKQLFYNYFLIYENYLSKLDKKQIGLRDIRDEYDTWQNILIRPTREEKSKYKITMKDGLTLTTLKVNINEVIANYISQNPKDLLINKEFEREE